MSHIGQFARALKVHLNRVQARVSAHFWRAGSVLENSAEAGCEKIEIHYEIESQEEPARIAAVLRNARGACYVRETLRVSIEDSITLNGRSFDRL